MNTRKSVLVLKTLFLAAVFTGLFVSCEHIVDGDDTKYSYCPDVEALYGDKSGIGITSKYRSVDTDYIYVYRIEVVDEGEEQPLPVNIGIINQDGFKRANTFLFQDQYVTADKKYKYRTVFHDTVTGIYTSSGWSKVIKAKTGFGPLTYDSVSAPTNIDYNNLNSTLTSNKNINAMTFASPNEAVIDYTPTLVLKNESSSRYFPLTDDKTKELTYINLRDLVSDDFLNVPISAPYLVGMKIDYTTVGELRQIENPNSYEYAEGDDTEVIKRIYFSNPLDISGLISMPSDVSEIVITTFQGTGIFLPEVTIQ